MKRRYRSRAKAGMVTAKYAKYTKGTVAFHKNLDLL